MKIGSLLNRDRQRKLGAFAVVLAAHVGVFALIARTQPTPLQPMPPVFEVQLFPAPPPPVPPPPPADPAERSGGGAPAAPSRIHVPPDVPPDVPPELPAPPVPAPEPALVVGMAPIDSATPGMGQGGQGTGTGTGTGAGSGPGSGSGPRFVRGPTQGEILAMVPAEARAARRAGRASVNCEIQSDTRLDRCRLVSESPSGFRFGEAALRIAPAYFRFRPATTAGGEAVTGSRVTVVVEFGRQGGG